MKANINDNPLEIYRQIPNRWGNTFNYNKEGNEQLWYDDGFRDVIIAEVNPMTHKKGELYFDEENDFFKIDAIALTQQELDDLAESKIPLTLNASQLRQALILQGITPDDVLTAINTLPSPQKELMLVKWEYEMEYHRNSTEVLQIAAILQLNEQQLKDIFNTGKDL